MTWTTAGEIVTATKLNEVFPAGDDAWQAWTPSYTNLTVGNGTVVARYIQVGDLVVARWHLNLGSTSVMGSNPQISPPVAASSTGYASLLDWIGGCSINDTGTEQYIGFVRFVSTNLSPFVLGSDGTYTTIETLTATVPMTWTTGDDLMFTVVYEAA